MEQYPVSAAWLSLEGFEAESFETLAKLAIGELTLLGRAGIVCGPISTGGCGSAEDNFLVFNRTIISLQDEGFPIFSQIPYESGIGKLRQAWNDAGNSGYCMPILHEFYAPLFRTGLITCAWFIPGWESSFGARWEREECKKLGIKTCDLDPGWIKSLL